MLTLYSIARTALKHILGRGSMRSYSQFGEDAFIASLFRNKTDGYYIDVGAYHPHLYSNTYAFYKRGWRGVVIDPNPSMRTLFRVFRPRDTFINAGVGVGERRYHEHADGAYNDFTPGTGTRLRPLRDIVHEQRIARIDLLDIDVEGMDLEVLQTHDWSVAPAVVAVESAAGSAAQAYLEEKGYELKGILGPTLVFKRRSVTPR